jgi:hypothetical protein
MLPLRKVLQTSVTLLEVYATLDLKVAHSRVSGHHRRYTFDTVFFLPWPGDDLDRIEGALIRSLRPPFNGKKCTLGKPHKDEEVLATLGALPAQTPSGVFSSQKKREN